jgi:hypothetical protein
MSVQTSQDPDALPQLIGVFHPVDWWQSHLNEIFYGLYAARLRDYYQTFASADYRLGHALAEDYYRQLCEREKTRSQSGEKKVTQPGNRTLTIMEWGGGNGNLAACFLDRLKELDKEGTFYPAVQYVLIDKFESVLGEARKNPDLAKHQDRVTLLCAGVESLESFEDGTIDRIICNEVWSDLPTKLLIRRGGEVMEEYIRPNVSESKLVEIADWSGFVQAFDKKDTKSLQGFPRFLEDLLWEREYHKVEAKTLPFRRTIWDFLKGLVEEVLVPINVGACATLKEAKRLLASDSIGFSSFDAGTADLQVLGDPEKPCYTVHGGQFSFLVNLALLHKVGEHLGMKLIVIEPQKEYISRSLGANVLTLMDLMASHRNIPSQDSWEFDAFIFETIKSINTSYHSPYQRTIDFPLRETTPAHEREKLEKILRSFQLGGVPDTIAYLTEDEVWGAMQELEQLGYEREDIRAALTAPPQPVDYYHFSFSPTGK